MGRPQGGRWEPSAVLAQAELSWRRRRFELCSQRSCPQNLVLGGGSNDTSFTPGRPALMAPPGAMKVMGGAGITENLDRPNMPVSNTIVTFDNYFKQTSSGSSAGARAVGGAVESTVKERRRSGG